VAFDTSIQLRSKGEIPPTQTGFSPTYKWGWGKGETYGGQIAKCVERHLNKRRNSNHRSNWKAGENLLINGMKFSPLTTQQKPDKTLDRNKRQRKWAKERSQSCHRAILSQIITWAHLLQQETHVRGETTLQGEVNIQNESRKNPQSLKRKGFRRLVKALTKKGQGSCRDALGFFSKVPFATGSHEESWRKKGNQEQPKKQGAFALIPGGGATRRNDYSALKKVQKNTTKKRLKVVRQCLLPGLGEEKTQVKDVT